MKIIRCDNAGENKVLERESDKNELEIIFEYTAPGTPQQNGVVERAFVTVMGRARTMMNHAGFTMAKRQHERIPSTTPGAEPPRDAKDSGSARSHSMHLETSSSDRP